MEINLQVHKTIRRNMGRKMRFTLLDGSTIDAYIDDISADCEMVYLVLQPYVQEPIMTIKLEVKTIKRVEFIFEDCKMFALNTMIGGLNLAPQTQEISYTIPKETGSVVWTTHFENILFRIPHINDNNEELRDNTRYVTATGIEVIVNNPDVLVEITPTVGQGDRNE